MRPRNLEQDDHISIDKEGLSDAQFRVSSIEVEAIGITEVVAVGLVCGCDRYALTGATADSSFTLEHRESDEEWQVFAQFISVED